MYCPAVDGLFFFPRFDIDDTTSDYSEHSKLASSRYLFLSRAIRKSTISTYPFTFCTTIAVCTKLLSILFLVVSFRTVRAKREMYFIF